MSHHPEELPQVDQGLNAKVNIFSVWGICGKLSESILEMHVTPWFYTRSGRVHRFQLVPWLWVPHHCCPLPLPFLAVGLLESWETVGSTGDSQGHFILIFLNLVLIGLLLYSVMLVSAARQGESAISTHVSPPSRTSFPPRSCPTPLGCNRALGWAPCHMATSH